MTKLRFYINRILKTVLVVLMGVLLIDVCWQVFSRYILQSPSSFTDELARYLLIWLSLLGAAYMVGEKEHIAINILSKKLDKRLQSIIINGSVLVFSVLVMVIGGTNLVLTILSLDQLSATLQIPMGYIYLALPLSGILISFYSVTNITESIKEGAR
ncbi:MAG: TRAP transporter small permease [Balneolaceae bacterium]